MGVVMIECNVDPDEELWNVYTLRWRNWFVKWWWLLTGWIQVQMSCGDHEMCAMGSNAFGVGWLYIS